MEVLEAQVKLRRNKHHFYLNLFKKIKEVGVFSLPNDDYFANYWLTIIIITPNSVKEISREVLRLAFDKTNIESRP
jgi:dTDP-4-amino-4,6-dideoxygalactose transaminase